jgi:hypothetical protein
MDFNRPRLPAVLRLPPVSLLVPVCLPLLNHKITDCLCALISSIISSRLPNEVESDFITWRNYTLTNVSGIVGPLIAGVLCNISFLGRRYTMVVGALLTMVFFFGYTAVSTKAQNIGFSCTLGIFHVPLATARYTRHPLCLGLFANHFCAKLAVLTSTMERSMRTRPRFSLRLIAPRGAVSPLR